MCVSSVFLGFHSAAVGFCRQTELQIKTLIRKYFVFGFDSEDLSVRWVQEELSVKEITSEELLPPFSLRQLSLLLLFC